MAKIKILILCTGNSCRSQMAHGFLKKYCSDIAEIYSAGVEVHGVNPITIQVMAEVGIGISTHTSNHIEEYKCILFDYMITVCDHARETCPYVPTGAIKIHHNFPDPAKARGTQTHLLSEYRKVRDLIRVFCKEFAENLLQKKSPDGNHQDF